MKKRQCERKLQDDRGRNWRANIVRTLLAVALGASLLTPVSAAMVFEQSPLDGNDPFPSISGEQSADGFTLSTTTAVTGLTWWGSYSQDPATLPADVFSVRIFADDGSGKPVATPPTETISQQPTRLPTELPELLDASGALVYRFDVDLVVPFTLDGGKNWYLSVINQFDIGDPNAAWYWSLSDTTGENFYRAVDGGRWSSDLKPPTGNLAFQVRGNPGTAIPLPGSLLLVLAGLAGLNLVGLGSRLRLTAPVDG